MAPISPLTPALPVALISGGLHAGSLLFVSAVSCRTVGRLIAASKADILRVFFRAWWPAGRDLMAPLSVTSAAAYAWLAVVSGERSAAVASVSMIGVIAWTKLAMGEDINSLLSTGPAADTATFATAKQFCARHHIRAVASMGVFGWVAASFLA